MPGDQSGKRQRPRGSFGRRKHDKKKFRKITNPSVRKSDLTGGLSGILFSCTPHRENQAYREAALLLSKHCEELDENPEIVRNNDAEKIDGNGKNPQEEKPSDNKVIQEGKTVLKSLDDELDSLRNEDDNMFTQVETNVNGAVFIRINKPSIDLEGLVEKSLREARASGSPNSRHCIRIIPVHTTCYAKPEEAAKAAALVAKEHFPKLPETIEEEKSDDHSKKASLTYAIAFRARLNSGVHRDDYISAIATAVQNIDSRYKVNLTAPDVTLIVEVLKTSCCIGTFRHFFQLAKMNLREAACPSAPNDGEKPKEIAKKNESCESKDALTDLTNKETKEIVVAPPEATAQSKDRGTATFATADESKTKSDVSPPDSNERDSPTLSLPKEGSTPASTVNDLAPQSGQSVTTTVANSVKLEGEEQADAPKDEEALRAG